MKWSELLLQLAAYDHILHQPLPRLPAAAVALIERHAEEEREEEKEKQVRMCVLHAEQV